MYISPPKKNEAPGSLSEWPTCKRRVPRSPLTGGSQQSQSLCWDTQEGGCMNYTRRGIPGAQTLWGHSWPAAGTTGMAQHLTWSQAELRSDEKSPDPQILPSYL